MKIKYLYTVEELFERQLRRELGEDDYYKVSPRIVAENINTMKNTDFLSRMSIALEGVLDATVEVRD